jgi:hypothetical protein
VSLNEDPFSIDGDFECVDLERFLSCGSTPAPSSSSSDVVAFSIPVSLISPSSELTGEAMLVVRYGRSTCLVDQVVLAKDQKLCLNARKSPTRCLSSIPCVLAHRESSVEHLQVWVNWSLHSRKSHGRLSDFIPALPDCD